MKRFKSRCKRENCPMHRIYTISGPVIVGSKENIKTCSKEYYLKHRRDRIKPHQKVMRAYFKTQAGKGAMAKVQAKRRHFEYVPLNKIFDGSNGHHIDEVRVINIPKEMHKEERHSVTQDRNMEAINTMAFNWLEAEELYANYLA